MSQVRLQLHPLFPTPVASYSGFDQQEVLFETVSSLLKMFLQDSIPKTLALDIGMILTLRVFCKLMIVLFMR